MATDAAQVSPLMSFVTSSYKQLLVTAELIDVGLVSQCDFSQSVNEHLARILIILCRPVSHPANQSVIQLASRSDSRPLSKTVIESSSYDR